MLERRLLWLKIAMIAVFIFLMGVFADVQLIRQSRFLQLSQENRIRRVWIPAPRGKILDRKGVLLVGNRASFDVALDDRALKERKSAVAFFSSVFNVSADEIEETIKNQRGPAYLPIPIKKDVDMGVLTQVEESLLQMPWVTVEVNPVRQYVLGKCAAGVLGYVGAINRTQYESLKDCGYHWLDVIGKTGIESACEAYLRGESGGMQIEVDHRGHREEILTIQKPIPGRDVYLTLDLEIQKALEEVLEGKIGAGIVMDPRSGELLGVASSPSFDLNLFIRPDLRKEAVKLFVDPQKPLVNRAFQGLYSPGSTFKLVVASAGLDLGLAHSATSFECDGGLKVGGAYFRCWKEGGHGTVTLREAIQYSCNVFFYQLGMILGPERIAEYARRFGLGTATGLDVGYEREGFIPTPQWKRQQKKEGWYGGDTANFAIGQGFISVTPLQMAVLTSAIANGGKWMSPLLVKKVILPEGRTLFEASPHVKGDLTLPREVLAEIQKGMWGVVNDARGTGRLASLPNVEICGKTGTAQVMKGTEVTKQGWFVSYAPADHPRFVLVMLVEGVYSGGQDVAPLARRVYEQCFNYNQ